MIKVKVIYRNYIPLYACYSSFWLEPIEGIEVIIPPVKPGLKKLFKIYRKIMKFPGVDFIVSVVQKIVFPSGKTDNEEEIDLLFYAGVLPDLSVETPFIIDFEHVHALFNNGNVTGEKKKAVLEILKDEKCKKIVPWSHAAIKTLSDLYENDYKLISHKVEVLHPGLPNYLDKYKGMEDREFVKENKKLKLLFVGKDLKRKGLIELFEAIQHIPKEKIELHCISDMNEKDQQKYQNLGIRFYPYTFSHEDIIKKFFMTCDFYITPTHEDTFGMVFLEALSSGIPIITTDQFAASEFLIPGVNGYFVESDKLFLNKSLFPQEENGTNYDSIETKLVDSITTVLTNIINDRSLLKRVSIDCNKEFKAGGMFSISLRNKKLQRIIKESIERK